MTEYAFILAIAGVLAIGAMSPGPSFLVVARNSLARSRAHGVATALGTGLGVAIFAVLASFGVTTLIEQVPTAYLVFKLVGGGYLLYLAWRIFSSAAEPIQVDTASSRKDQGYGQAFFQGLVTQTSNPKTALVIAGIFAAFVPQNPPPNTAALVAIIAFVIDFSWYACVALVLSAGRSRSAYLRSKSAFDRTAGLFLGMVGIRLLIPDQ